MTVALTVQRVESPEALAGLAEECSSLAFAMQPRLPFAMSDWLQPWWRHFREDRLLVRDEFYVHALRDAQGTLVALAPLMLTERPANGPLRCRSLAFFGSDKNVTELRGLICAPEHEAAAARALLAHLAQRNDEWDWFVWNGVRANSEAYALLAGTDDFEWRHETIDYVLPLHGTWQEFRATRSRNIKESLRKCYNSLKRANHRFEFRVIEEPAELPRALHRFFELHALRASAPHLVRHEDVFAMPRARALLLELAALSGEASQLRVFQLEIAGSVVASRLGFLMGDELYLYFSGYDPGWGAFSVMTTTVAETVKWAIERRVRLLNLSPGTDVSKTRWGALPVRTCAGVLLSPRRRGRLTFQVLQELNRRSGPETLLGKVVKVARRNGWRPSGVSAELCSSSGERLKKPAAKTAAGASIKEDALTRYRDKRDPLSTNEPFGAEHKQVPRETRTGRFVVHLHDATRPHYDVRLQIGGTLKSFAVPRGPSLSALDKKLAVLTEDHPLEYLEFEEVIPEGNYGAGAMIVWDVGRVRYLETTAERGLEIGKLDFELDGFKLHGRFALVATGRRKAEHPGDKKASEWLLIKKQDAFAHPPGDILIEQPHSVMSGLTVAELAERERVVSELEAEAEALGALRAPVEVSNATPMLCALSGAELTDPSRLYELKIDGVRIVADKHARAVALRYRNGRAASSSYPEIARAVATLAPERVVLDGEVVAFDEQGRPSFQRIAPRIHAERPLDVKAAMNDVPVSYLVFDLLALNDFDLRPLPLAARKSLLLKLIRGKGYVRALDHLEGDGQALFDLCRAERLEGVVAKRADAPYRHGPRRTEDWVKIKTERDDQFVVIGFMRGKGARAPLGALCVASYSGERLLYRGRVGSGLDAATLGSLEQTLQGMRVDAFPAHGTPPEDAKGAEWVRPELVVNVRFLGFTEGEARLRAPVFQGLRTDLSPTDCRAAPPDELIEEAPALPPADPSPPQTGSATTRVAVTNSSKIFWPDEGYTKGDLCAYYAAIAEVMLPFLHERPVVLVRYPDGIAGKHFYQWNVPVGTPDWIERIELVDEDDPGGQKKTLFLVDSADALVHIANLGCIPLHVLAAQRGSLDQCDFLTVDFDLGERPFSDAVRLALDLRAILDDVGLVGFPKTSGQKGLHVLVPMGPGVNYDTAKLLVELLGRLITDKNPTIATMERRVRERGSRVYVDTGQTGPSRTIVAPYSVRAHAGATVSAPISWQELHVALDTSRFSMLTMPGRVLEVGDPFAGFMSARPDVSAAVAALSKYL